jgi:N-acetylmuramoyl-L-alanine amidase
MFKIAYCAGHHLGNPKGVPKSMGLGEIREWTLNDRVARHFARAALEYDGVQLLRTDDPTGKTLIDIPERCAAANQWGADLYLDFHHNGGINGGKGGGMCAFSFPGSVEGKQYRNAIYEAVIAAGGLKGNRASPLMEKAFDSLRYSHMPAVLLEYGFMDSKTDAPVIVTEEYSRLVAYATMEGIAKAAGLQKLPKVQETDVFYRVQVGAFNDPLRAEALADKLRAAGFGEPLVLAVKR